MRTTKKKQPLSGNLSMNGTALDEADYEFKDLDILTDRQLSWNKHEDRVSAKANQILGLISRCLSFLHDQVTLRTIYCSLVRPHLDYCSVVWSPHTQRNINMLERRVQRRATKMIRRSRNSNYEERLRKLDLFLLEQRRLLLDVVFFSKAINGHLNIDVTPYLQFYTEHDQRYSLRGKDTLTIKKIGCRTNLFKYS